MSLPAAAEPDVPSVLPTAALALAQADRPIEVCEDGRSAAPDLPLHALLLVAAFAAAVTAQGAFYLGGQRVTGLLVGGALVAALRSRRWSGSDSRLPPLLACAALGVWVLVDTGLVGGRPASTLVLLACLAAVVVTCRRIGPVGRDSLAGALVVVGALVAATGWVGVAWRVDPWALEDQGLWRAATTLTYANAAAGLLVPLALLAVGRAMSGGRRPSHLLLVYALLVGAGATLSRGGAIALLVGVVALAWWSGVLPTLRTLGPPAVGAGVALAGLALSMPASAPSRPVVAVVALGAGLALVKALSRARSAAVVAGVVIVALGAGVSALAGPHADAAGAVGGARLTAASDHRRAETSAAVDLVARRPLTGTGPGRAVLVWKDADGTAWSARFVHNEYLQVAAELGLVGLALLVALVGTLGLAVRRARAQAPSPAAWAGAAAALMALGVHSALDFLWHVPAVALTGALLVGITIAANEREQL